MLSGFDNDKIYSSVILLILKFYLEGKNIAFILEPYFMHKCFTIKQYVVNSPINLIKSKLYGYWVVLFCFWVFLLLLFLFITDINFEILHGGRKYSIFSLKPYFLHYCVNIKQFVLNFLIK